MKKNKIYKSFFFAFSGIFYLIKTERNFQIHLIAALLTICLGVLLNISLSEWIQITACIAVVWFAESFNTALEKLCDMVKPEIHPQIKIIKDVSAGAVLIAAIASVVIGLLIFVPRLIDVYFSIL